GRCTIKRTMARIAVVSFRLPNVQVDRPVPRTMLNTLAAQLRYLSAFGGCILYQRVRDNAFHLRSRLLLLGTLHSSPVTYHFLWPSAFPLSSAARRSMLSSQLLADRKALSAISA